jgi:hypothetical protein
MCTRFARAAHRSRTGRARDVHATILSRGTSFSIDYVQVRVEKMFISPKSQAKCDILGVLGWFSRQIGKKYRSPVKSEVTIAFLGTFYVGDQSPTHLGQKLT